MVRTWKTVLWISAIVVSILVLGGLEKDNPTGLDLVLRCVVLGVCAAIIGIFFIWPDIKAGRKEKRKKKMNAIISRINPESITHKEPDPQYEYPQRLPDRRRFS